MRTATSTSRRTFLLATAAAGAAALTGCTDGLAGRLSTPVNGAPLPAEPDSSGAASAAPAVPLRITLVAVGAQSGQPLSPRPVLRPTVTGGQLQTVVVTGTDGAQVAGTGAPDGSWTPAEPLELGRSYTAVATAVAAAVGAVATGITGDVASGGTASQQTATAQLAFTVATKDITVAASVMPSDGEVVGVGMPIVVSLNREVPLEHRSHLTNAITLDVAGVEGAWRWISDSEVHWRPRQYWPAGTKVSVDLPLTQLQLGGRWGREDRRIAFTVGDTHIAVADTNTHQMTVSINGAVAKVIPISAGREDSDPAFVTRSGVHLVLDKHADYVMDGRTVGQDYVTPVKWATRIANSGEFVHGAPWSVPSQGKRNVSHGCLNASNADAKWFYGIAQRGDVVQVTGTNRPMELTNGLGDWTLDWQQWTTPQT